MLYLIEHMYVELGLVEEFNINLVIFRKFMVRKLVFFGGFLRIKLPTIMSQSNELS